MRMAKAPQEHVDRLRRWMQFNDEFCKIDPTNQREWDDFKKDWEDEDDFMALVLNRVKDKIKKPSLDQLLEKVGNKGVESLTPFEKDTLDAYSKN